MSIELLLLAMLFAPQADTITVRGRVVCLIEEKTAVETVGEHEHEYVFKTDSGKILPLFRSITSEALFVDERLHTRHLEVTAGLRHEVTGGLRHEVTGGLRHEVTGGLRDDTSIEVFQIRSIIDGQLHDVHYWCDTCAIRANSPGPCWCCYQPFEFRETPMGPGK